MDGLDFNCVANPSCGPPTAIAFAVFVLYALTIRFYLVKRGGFSWRDERKLPFHEGDTGGKWAARSVAVPFFAFAIMGSVCALTACDVFSPAITSPRWLTIWILWLSAMMFAGIGMVSQSRLRQDGRHSRKWFWLGKCAKISQYLAMGAAIFLFALIVHG